MSLPRTSWDYRGKACPGQAGTTEGRPAQDELGTTEGRPAQDELGLQREGLASDGAMEEASAKEMPPETS